MPRACVFCAISYVAGPGVVYRSRLRAILERSSRAFSARTLFVGEGTRRMSEAVRMHLVDDHTIFRQGLEAILSREGMEVVGHSPTGEEAIDRIEGTRPDVVITQVDMDLSMAKGVIERARGDLPA